MSTARIHRESALQIPQSRSYRRTYDGPAMVSEKLGGSGLKQTGRTENRFPPSDVAECRSVRRSEGQLAQADREREQRLVLPKELRGLQDRVHIADRVLLLTDRPLTVEVHDRGEDVVQGHVRFEPASHRLLRGWRLVAKARFEGSDEGRSLRRLGRPEPKEVRIAEFRRQRAIQLPQEPGVLRRREVAAGKTRGVRLTQRVSQEPGFSARGDEERTILCVGFSFERERPEDLLDAIELPVLEETTQQLNIRLSRATVRERRDVERADALQTHRLDMPQVRERDEPTRRAEIRRGLGVRDGHCEIVTETSEVIE